MTFQHICDVNNQGVGLLAAGNAKDALVLFARAVAMIQQDNFCQGSEAPSLPLSIVPLEVDTSSSSFAIAVPQALQCFGTGCMAEEDKHTFCCVLNFNTALALQYQFGSSSSSKLEVGIKAVQCYKRSMKYLKMVHSTEDAARLIGLSVAAMSNMAEILFDMNRVEMSAKLMKMGQDLLQTEENIPIVDLRSRDCIAWNAHIFSQSVQLKRGASAA
ncbi:unknown protein [Seminavis robusta]|uniref:Uncharacterized protein n=1 Tax=Seminavis robusta TaxID=568900 RepID=A0A9N8ED02_9STRA|nr:unknown protein [Seminavis robusta]|eukprot:Sro765_g199140.1 n/a (216) ;mRNA; r:8401-9048